MNTIGERLQFTRTKNSLSQKEFAQILGVSQGALSGMEKNTRGIPMEAIINLIKYSKSNNSVSCEWILTGYDSTNNKDRLSEDEQDLLTNYMQLDKRGKYKVQTIIYEELDRVKKTADCRLGEEKVG